MTDAARRPPGGDGRRDFDFLLGRWNVENHKLRDPYAPSSSDWLEFDAVAENRSILNGLGNLDEYSAPEFPDRGRFDGLTLRLFDAATDVWRIWWTSTAAGGLLDTPVVGRFTGGHGVFECDDVLDGNPVKVRYEWLDITNAAAHWQQAFSFDGGKSWHPNWTMTWRRDR